MAQVKSLAALTRQIAREAEVGATRQEGLVQSLVVWAMVYAKLNNKSLPTGLDFAEGALDGLPDFTTAYVKKAKSYARAVVSHGTADGAPLKGVVLAASEEADLIAEAFAKVAKLKVRDAVAARVAANGAKSATVAKPELNSTEAAARTARSAIARLVEAARAGDETARLAVADLFVRLARVGKDMAAPSHHRTPLTLRKAA